VDKIFEMKKMFTAELSRVHFLVHRCTGAQVHVRTRSNRRRARTKKTSQQPTKNTTTNPRTMAAAARSSPPHHSPPHPETGVIAALGAEEGVALAALCQQAERRQNGDSSSRLGGDGPANHTTNRPTMAETMVWPLALSPPIPAKLPLPTAVLLGWSVASFWRLKKLKHQQ